MRVGVFGAGAVGGYFGGRLVEKGVDVTFLVRPKRKQELSTGLVIKSPFFGDARLPVSLLTVGEDAPPFDLLIVAVKAYHLESAIPFMQFYSHSQTTILPLLNGYAHMERLQECFPTTSIMGGYCFMESTLNESGEVLLLANNHQLVFGELDLPSSRRISQLNQLFQGAKFNARHSKTIRTEMWNKYQHIAAYSGMTTLMRSDIGTVLSSPHGPKLYQQLLEEIYSVAIKQPLPTSPDNPEVLRHRINQLHPQSKSSMLRDFEKNLPLESEHLHGNLIRWGQQWDLSLPILTTIYTTLTLNRD